MSLCRDPKFQDLKSFVEVNEKDRLSIYEQLLNDPERFNKYTRTIDTPDGTVLFDFSKHRISDTTFEKLMELVRPVYHVCRCNECGKLFPFQH
ncbi:unnamed protein product [Strongylus vulgaris]|uniref:Uncharacterized protein n=1 Tax=Strongylus vulgaris TaxID=40348 RepID=A0A3P7IUN4_STRVU|nr:unnamed protein product [Strongylus vulgaris]